MAAHISDAAPAPDQAPSSAARTWRQRKITELFPLLQPLKPLKPVPRVSFLSLPRHIRDKIYDEANIGGGKFIAMNFRSMRTQWIEQFGDGDGNVDDNDQEFMPGDDQFYDVPKFPAGLLRANRVIHLEVESKLFAENTFAVCSNAFDGLRPLETISTWALGKLKVLIVCLQRCSCLTPCCPSLPTISEDVDDDEDDEHNEIDWKDEFWSACDPKSHNTPLDSERRYDKKTIAQWQRVCKRLASHASPELKLYFLANVADLKTATAILDPLQGMPVIREAAISLSALPLCSGRSRVDGSMRALARQTALRLMGKQPPNTPFRFFSLPLELQVLILQNTDLVAEDWMSWRQRDGYFILNDQFSANDHWNCRDRFLTYDHPPRAGSPEDEHINWTIFCSSRNAAFSPRCEGDQSPLNYYLVSKAFGALARSVFFSRNEIRLSSIFFDVVRGFLSGGLVADPDDHIDDLPLLAFLRRISREDIRNLRHLTLVFPPLAPSYMAASSTEETLWHMALCLLAENANLPRLKLEIHFPDIEDDPAFQFWDHSSDQSFFMQRSLDARIQEDPIMEMLMEDMYRRVTEPLAQLGQDRYDLDSLRAILIYVAWPVREDADDERWELEWDLEREVMGEDYNSDDWGKRIFGPHNHVSGM